MYPQNSIFTTQWCAPIIWPAGKSWLCVLSNFGLKSALTIAVYILGFLNSNIS